ncbi:acyl-CoA dehydrogenase family protein [Mycolicibacterium sp.]|uniref:acyl-CoA dehydrogenase family protein n=1 Tax=Mycolicibacterium sp. TaxID=2320850 RepID=UPI0028B0A34F|nr:acyl-CoA dehydrogenase family protein [Mycolicibacterium sp.]
MSLLFNPSTYDPSSFDEGTRLKLLALVDFFETKGLAKNKEEYYSGEWYTDYLTLIADQRIFADFGTPAEVGRLVGDDPGKNEARWDLARINELNEILGFYSLAHWYAWQVSVLGLGPVWLSANQDARKRVAELLAEGHIFGFGLSEREHGADIYSSDMILTRTAEGGFTASGGKWYIGNGNAAGRLSVYGKFADDDPEHPGEHVFFLVDPSHPTYELIKNVVAGQMFVAAFNLHGYPVAADDILHVGKAAFDAALATVNVGKVNLGWASIGICEHSFYEAVTHAHNRILYGNRVTDFPHVRRMLADAYARLVAMKIFAARSTDYFRSASEDDRRFLLFNPITKAKVTSEGERVIDLLWDVIAARGFERDTYFSRAASDIRALPKLEGTVHVNIALVLKFMPRYLGAAHGAAQEYPEIPVRQDAGDDAYLFHQGPAKGLGSIGFADWRPAFDRFADLTNVQVFREQIDAFTQLVLTAPPTEEQQKDLDYLQVLGQLFTQIVYAQLILESAAMALDHGQTRPGSVSDLSDLTEAHLDRMVAVFVNDMSTYAVELHGQASATDDQAKAALSIVRKPVIKSAAENAFVAEVLSYSGTYEMKR